MDPRTGIVDPGIYGWGSITDISYYTTRTGKEKEDEIEFVVKPPSNFLKDKPLWNNDINHLMNEIRRRQYMGVFFKTSDVKLIFGFNSTEIKSDNSINL